MSLIMSDEEFTAFLERGKRKLEVQARLIQADIEALAEQMREPPVAATAPQADTE